MEKTKSLIVKLKEYFSKLDISEDAKTEESKEETTELADETKEVKLEQMALKDGALIEAESFEAGAEVFAVTDEGGIPLPIGDYELDDGRILSIVEVGIISEIKAMESEETEQAQEFVTVDTFNAFVEEVKGMLTNLSEEKTELSKVEDKKVELEKLNEDLQKQLDEKPDAKPIVHKPELKTKAVKFEDMTNFQKLKYNEEKGLR